jgi:flagellar biosynthesis/type III secretory pathway M-ring protein FliF/YscJ
MAAWIWILIAIGVLAVLGLVVFGALRGREKARRREQAQELRQEAEKRKARAVEQEQQARESHRVAAQVGARADQIDPDRNGSSDGE